MRPSPLSSLLGSRQFATFKKNKTKNQAASSIMPRRKNKPRRRRDSSSRNSTAAVTSASSLTPIPTPNRFLSRITKLNCAAAAAKVHDTRHQDVRDDTMDPEFDVQEQPLPTHGIQKNRTRSASVAPSLSSVQEVEEDDYDSYDKDDDDDSNDYFTDDDSSASSGLQVNTMDADSTSSDDEFGDYEDEAHMRDSEHRIGIRPFELPLIAPSYDDDEEDDDNYDHSPALSPPVLSSSNSSVGANEQAGDYRKDSKVEEWAKHHLISKDEESEMEQELVRIQAALEKLRHEQKVEVLVEQHDQKDNEAHVYLAPFRQQPDDKVTARVKAADDIFSHGAHPASSLEKTTTSPISNNGFMLVEPPKLQRQLATAYKTLGYANLGSNETSRRGVLKNIRLCGSQEFVDEHPQQPPILFHADGHSSHSFRSSSPGIEPADQHFRTSNRLPGDKTIKSKSFRPRSPPPAGLSDLSRFSYGNTVLARVHALNGGARSYGSVLSGNSNDRRPPAAWKPTQKYNVRASLASLSDKDSPESKALYCQDGGTAKPQPKVRWSSDILSTTEHSHAPSIKSDAKSIYRPRSSGPETTSGNICAITDKANYPNQAIYSHEDCHLNRPPARIVGQQPTGSTLSSMSWNSGSLGNSSTSIEKEPLKQASQSFQRNSAAGTRQSHPQTSLSTAVATGTHVSEQAEASFSSIKDLINKFDSQALSKQIHQLPKQKGELKSATCPPTYVDVLARRPNEVKAEATTPASKSHAHDDSANSHSGFFWRSHPSGLPPALRDCPVANDRLAAGKALGSKAKRLESPTNSIDADGMTTGTDTTLDTTTDDERQHDFNYHAPLRSSWMP